MVNTESAKISHDHQPSDPSESSLEATHNNASDKMLDHAKDTDSRKPVTGKNAIVCGNLDSGVAIDSNSDTGSDTGSNAESQNSTVEYNHEPFETFQSRALALAHSTIWPGTAPGTVTVERLHGGGYNRIIGLTLQADNESYKTVNYVLRIPRFMSSRVEDDVAILLLLRRHCEVPCPSVVTFDVSDENELGQSYAIHDRVEGVSLYHNFRQVSHADRCRVATELGTIVRRILAFQSSMSGRVVLSPTDRSLTAPLYVKPWYSEDIVPFTASAASQSTLDMLTVALQAWEAEEMRLRPHTMTKPNVIHQFITVARQMGSLGYLRDIPFSLAHLDLAARYIMIREKFEPGKPVITAILDWDSAVFAPMFMACDPPVWLWDFERVKGEEVKTVYDWGETPDCDASLPRDQELKRLFEEAAGPDYVRVARNPVYSMARRLMRFIADGLLYSEHFREGEKLLLAWIAAFRQAKQARNGR